MALYSIFNCRVHCDGHINPCDYHRANSSCPSKSRHKLPSSYRASWDFTTCHVKDCIIIAISYSELLQHYIRSVANMPKNSPAQEKKVNAAVRFLQTTIGVKVPSPWLWLDFRKRTWRRKYRRSTVELGTNPKNKNQCFRTLLFQCCVYDLRSNIHTFLS